LSLEQIFESLPEIEDNPGKLWKCFHGSYGKDFFLTIIEKEYGPRFAKDFEKVYTDIDDISLEAHKYFNTVTKQSMVEITNLRN